MSELPSLTPHKIITILKEKGFILLRTKGSHQIYRNPKTKRMVVVPLHKKDLPKGTFHEIIKQAGIKKEEIK